jgi:6-pyruvoyltetrahydropterin/6-carboxytetrahydropterin synthase
MLRAPSSSIYVRHNVEIAHRLMNLPGKCQNIHGHSLIVTMRIDGPLNENGILLDLDFSAVKKGFRNYLDSRYDHHLLLNKDDPWAQQLRSVVGQVELTDDAHYTRLPGLATTPGDPTTENIARWICDWAVLCFEAEGVTAIHIDVQETGTNGALVKWSQ